jgi:hypothetical protein
MNILKIRLARRHVSLAGILFAMAALGATAQEKQLPKYSDAASAEHAGEEAIVTGRVVAVAKSKGGTTYLNFGDRFPRQTFSGVVLVRDEEKVGDVKKYENKTVSITGKIELSREKKPQIVIKSAAQISLEADPTHADPATAIKPSSSAAPPASGNKSPAVPAKASASTRKIVLGSGWNSPAQSGELTRKDLATVFSGCGKASEATDGDPSIVVYPDISFLTSLPEVKKKLKLDGVTSSKSKVVCPGIPFDSFWMHVFAGVFVGGFDRLCLITDAADQVISVQLVEDTSRQRMVDVTDLAGYHTYNFVSYRVKGSGNLVIKHEVAGGGRGVVIVESALIDPNDDENLPPIKSAPKASAKTATRARRTGKVLERSRWFVPTAVVNLILRCAENR